VKGDAVGVVFSTFSGNTSVMSASGGTGFMRGLSFKNSSLSLKV
jgi:hypothetical protein